MGYSPTGFAPASSPLPDGPRGYVSAVLSRAADLVVHPAPVEPLTEPELTTDVEAHLAAALRRLLRTAALVDAAVTDSGCSG